MSSDLEQRITETGFSVPIIEEDLSVLIVEDDIKTAVNLIDLIQELAPGSKIKWADSVERAKELSHEDTYDLVLLDYIGLPNGTSEKQDSSFPGDKVINTVKKTNSLAYIVATTGHFNLKEHVTSLKNPNRANEFLRKPYTAGQIYNCLENVANRKRSYLDPLTESYNRRYIESQLKREIERIFREGTRFSIIYYDLDNFKPLNDQLGHEKGDCALKEVITKSKKITRATDYVSRLGGDEFLILLSGANENEAQKKAEELREKISSIESAKNENGEKTYLGASFGITEINPEDSIFLLYGEKGRELVSDYITTGRINNKLIDCYLNSFDKKRTKRKHQTQKPQREDLIKKVKEASKKAECYLQTKGVEVNKDKNKLEKLLYNEHANIAVNYVMKIGDTRMYVSKEAGKGRITTSKGTQ